MQIAITHKLFSNLFQRTAFFSSSQLSPFILSQKTLQKRNLSRVFNNFKHLECKKSYSERILKQLRVSPSATGFQTLPVLFCTSNIFTYASNMKLETLHGLECAVLAPEGKHESTIVWLHGLGDSHAGFQDVFQQYLKKKTMKVILPNAPKIPITINGGYVMPGWYDITSFDRLQNNEDKERMIVNASKVASIIKDEISLVDNAKKVILGGFSQGSALSLLTCFGFLENQIGGVICCSGYWLLRNEPEISLKYKNNTPILVWHGANDQVVDFNYAKQSYQMFQDKYGEGLNLEFHSSDFEHFLSIEEINNVRKWLESKL